MNSSNVSYLYEARPELWNERTKRENWSAFGDEWDAVDKKLRLKLRPTPYGANNTSETACTCFFHIVVGKVHLLMFVYLMA